MVISFQNWLYHYASKVAMSASQILNIEIVGGKISTAE